MLDMFDVTVVSLRAHRSSDHLKLFIKPYVIQVNKSLRLTANAIQNYSFEKSDKIPTDLPDDKDSGISKVGDRLITTDLQNDKGGLSLFPKRAECYTT